MTTVTKGSMVLIDVQVLDPAGRYFDPAQLRFRLKSPSGVETVWSYPDPAITRTGLGRYQLQTTPQDSGTWLLRVETETMAEETSFTVTSLGW